MFLVGMVVATGCGRAPAPSHQLVASEGAPALIRDCEALWAENQRTQIETWVGGDTNLPSSVAALRPQIVQVAHRDGFPMVDIQTSGGFTHRGLMVILTNTPPGFAPRKSSWRVTKITDNVFEYRE
jgi:hypothetical protein